jgi:transcriptional regulator with XRE-family HTH domain
MSVDDLVEEVPIAVGRRVRQARTDRGLTLDQLADRSGVSRRMIINVEAGTSNASITTLLRLATALSVPLPDLVGGGTGGQGCTITTSATRSPLWTGESGGTGVLVAAADMLELWDWTMQPGESYRSEAHRGGTRELLHIVSGRLRLVVDGTAHDLQPGDGVSFSADVPHSYACHGRRPVRFSMTVLEPMSRMQP